MRSSRDTATLSMCLVHALRGIFLSTSVYAHFYCTLGVSASYQSFFNRRLIVIPIFLSTTGRHCRNKSLASTITA